MAHLHSTRDLQCLALSSSPNSLSNAREELALHYRFQLLFHRQNWKEKCFLDGGIKNSKNEPRGLIAY